MLVFPWSDGKLEPQIPDSRSAMAIEDRLCWHSPPLGSWRQDPPDPTTTLLSGVVPVPDGSLGIASHKAPQSQWPAGAYKACSFCSTKGSPEVLLSPCFPLRELRLNCNVLHFSSEQPSLPSSSHRGKGLQGTRQHAGILILGAASRKPRGSTLRLPRAHDHCHAPGASRFP